MYERFTDRARAILKNANEEAKRFNHEYVGTEHMLLGIVKDKDSVAALLLGKVGIDLRKIRLEVEKLVQTGPPTEMSLMGRLPMTPRAKKVIELAIEAARLENKDYVGTDHVLLGMLREHDGVAGQVLRQLGVTDVLLKSEELLNGSQISEHHQDHLNKLYKLKEDAVLLQDFNLATKYRDEADEYKLKIAEETRQRLNKNPEEEILRNVSCMMFGHMTGKLTAKETVEAIRKLTNPE